MATLRSRLYTTIFGTTTPAGRLFDIVLLIAILLSVAVILMQSVPSLDAQYHDDFILAEWIFTGLFTVEYFLRIYVTPKPFKYIFSFYGFIDMLAIIPAYLSLVIGISQALSVIRILRIIRIFRVFGLNPFLENAYFMAAALQRSLYKIAVFSTVIICLVTVLGSLMYVVEGPENGFISIPVSIYWSVVTITTVGFGDITPSTPAGQFLATMIMLLGYSIIAVPTGIVAAEISKESRRGTTRCSSCAKEVDAMDQFCKNCGHKLRN
jgi:voltage-gated potassium channel